MFRRVMAIMLILLSAGASSRTSRAFIAKEIPRGFLTEALAPRPASNLAPLSRTPHQAWGSAAERAGLLGPRITAHRPSFPSPFNAELRRAKHQDGRQSHRSPKRSAYTLGNYKGLIRDLLNGDLSRFQRLFGLNRFQIDTIRENQNSQGDYASWEDFEKRHPEKFVAIIFNRVIEWIRNRPAEVDVISKFLSAKTTTAKKLKRMGFTGDQASALMQERDQNGKYLGGDDIRARLHGRATAVVRRLELFLVPFLSRHPSLTAGETRDRLRHEFLAFTGIVYYPCALTDIHSLIALARFFPHAHIMASDGFIQNEVSGVDLPNAGDPAAVEKFLRKEFMASSLIRSIKLYPLQRAPLMFNVTIQFSDPVLNRLPTLPRELRLKYKVGRLHDLPQPAGVLYVRQPGSAGGLFFDLEFWRDVIPRMELPGWILTADTNELTHEWHVTPPFKTAWMARVYQPTEDPEPLTMAGAPVFVWQRRFPTSRKPLPSTHRKLTQDA